jgi:hypothetical protein
MPDIANTPKNGLEKLRYEEIMLHALNPETSPLSPELQEQYNRILDAARLLDNHPDTKVIFNLLKHKYNKGRATLLEDIRLAKELFKTQHEFDWDFWFAWRVKDLTELIQQCRNKGDFKNWVYAQKELRETIGEKPEGIEDPKRMEKNVYNIQLNNNKTILNLDLDKLRKLPVHQLSDVINELTTPIDDEQAVEIMNS